MWVLQANNLANAAANSPHAPRSEASPELTWFFGALALFALVMTWIWLWTKMKASVREREKLLELQQQMREQGEPPESES